MVDNKLVPSDYQSVFESTKLPQQVLIVENKANCGESSQEEQLKQLREIVMMLKCLFLVCGLVLVSNLYAIVKSGLILCTCYQNVSIVPMYQVCSSSKLSYEQNVSLEV